MNRTIVVLSLLATALTFAANGSAQTLVVENGTIHSMSTEPVRGTVVVTDGVITAVGPDVEAPMSAQRIDATGLHVYPGIFDALGQLGLTEVGAVASTNDMAEMGMYNAHLMAATAIHPASELIPVARENGITHAIVAPRAGRNGVILGQAALINLDGWTVEEMAIDMSVAMVINWPEIVTRRWDWTTFSMKETAFEDAKEKADEQVGELRDWIDAARHYQMATTARTSRAVRDQKLAALSACLNDGKLVIVQANAKRDIEAAMKFAEAEGLRLIIAGGRDAWQLKEELATSNVSVILRRTQDTPKEQDDEYDKPFTAPMELHAAGVKIAFGSGTGGGYSGAHSARNLPYEAATAVAYGLSSEDAMRALTLWPAEMFGVSEALGSIDVGKTANLMITDGDPLEITTQVRHLVIAGAEVSTDNRHRDLYEKYRGRPHKLDKPAGAGTAASQ